VFVEKRREDRYSANCPVQLTILGVDPKGSNDRTVNGIVQDCSGRGMRIQLAERLHAGSAVRLDMDDQIVLGEVCYCQQSGDQFAIGLELEQSLTNLHDLTKLMSALIGESRSPNGVRASAPPH
jgi:hypothetical protein